MGSITTKTWPFSTVFIVMILPAIKTAVIRVDPLPIEKTSQACFLYACIQCGGALSVTVGEKLICHSSHFLIYFEHILCFHSLINIKKEKQLFSLMNKERNTTC